MSIIKMLDLKNKIVTQHDGKWYLNMPMISQPMIKMLNQKNKKGTYHANVKSKLVKKEDNKNA